MPGICRKGDSCSGHDNFPPRVNDQGSANVFVNGVGVHCKGDHWVIHCDQTPTCHDGTLATGSSTVFVNGKPVGRVGDKISCGSTVISGSGNVFAG